MQSSCSGADADFLNIGQIVRAHGIRGEVGVLLTTDWPEQFQANESFRFFKAGQGHQCLTIERVRAHKNQLILKLKSVDDRTAAEKLRGWFIQIDSSVRPELPENEYYITDLIGLKAVTPAGEALGILSDVLQHSGQDLYVIKNGQSEILIPAVQEFVKKIDVKAQVIVINPIEGLIENNED